MLNKLKQIIKDKDLIQEHDKIVVAVSGGPDSMALLLGLYELKDDYNLTLYVCHLDHQYRGQASKEDAMYVKRIADELSIESFIYSEDVMAFSQEHKLSFEEGARVLRYQLFDEVLKRTGSNKIAVAQNMNDQAETVLMRLFRGAGLEGLTAIKFKRDQIIRPLLGISREDIEAYCELKGIKARMDHTNFETLYTRNKVRLDLLPVIQSSFNDRIVDRLYETSQLLLQDLEFIESCVDQAYESVVSEDLITQVELKAFSKLAPAIQSRVLRKAIGRYIPQLKNVTQKHLKALQDLCKHKRHGKSFELGGIKCQVTYDNLLIFEDKQVLSDRVDVTIGQTLFYGDYRLESSKNNDKGINSITIDALKIQGQLNVRCRKNGDRFSPLGLKGSKKLKDFLINQKIPSAQRDGILLLCDDEEIVWVVGYRMSEKYKVENNTKDYITFKYHKE